MRYCLKLLTAVLLTGLFSPLFAGGVLRIADASRAGILALNALALPLAVEEKWSVTIDRVTPDEAKARFAAGRADLIVLEHGNLPAPRPRLCRMFAAEVLALYVNAANGIGSVELRDLKTLLTSSRPNWRPYYPAKNTDIHRYGLKPRAQGHGLAESLLGVEELARDIFCVSSTSQVILMAGGDPEAFGFGLLTPNVPADVKTLEVNGVPPTPGNVASGKYLLRWRYYVLAPESPTSPARRFLDEMKSASFYKELENFGFLPL